MYIRDITLEVSFSPNQQFLVNFFLVWLFGVFHSIGEALKIHELFVLGHCFCILMQRDKHISMCECMLTMLCSVKFAAFSTINVWTRKQDTIFWWMPNIRRLRSTIVVEFSFLFFYLEDWKWLVAQTLPQTNCTECAPKNTLHSKYWGNDKWNRFIYSKCRQQKITTIRNT